MKLGYSSKIGGYLLAFFLLFGVLTVASSNVQAQWRDRDRDRRDDRWERRNDDRWERRNDDRWERRNDRDDRYRDRDRYNNQYEVARQQGYSYGLSVGAADAQRGQNYSPQRSRYYRNATEGYNSYYGNRDQYKQVFRNAFEQGYREGFQRYAYNNNRNYRRGRIWPW